jgi:hypothetical protein
MTQFQFDMICKIIEQGAPALADELCGSLDTLVKAYNNIVVENEQIKAQLTNMKADDESEAK